VPRTTGLTIVLHSVPMQSDRHWVGTWTTAPAPAEGVAFSNHTLRM